MNFEANGQVILDGEMFVNQYMHEELWGRRSCIRTPVFWVGCVKQHVILIYTSSTLCFK